MPSNSAEYQRQYRERKRQAARQAEAAAAPTATPPAPEEVVAPPRKGYRCGCEPGSPCTGHLIQRMPQSARDAILARINRPPAG